MISDNMLLSNGYKQFNPPEIIYPYAETGFQKRFDDEVGKKYFITVIKYEKFEHPHTKETIPQSYEFEIQFSDKKTECMVNVLMFAGWDNIESVEQRAEDFWNMGCWNYYEEF